MFSTFDQYVYSAITGNFIYIFIDKNTDMFDDLLIQWFIAMI